MNPASNCVLTIIRHVWRGPGQQADPAFTIAHHTGPQSGAMQDNARPHMTCVAMNCLTACQTLPWPSRSPDLSLIKYVLDMIGRQLHLPANVDDWPDNCSKFGKKYNRRPSRCIITLCHVMRQLASRLDVGEHLIELVTF
ncbi:uncharacterized protein TNCV_1920691 [Trichonephila clavipes]|nr:uncharacterized protein TNCV_1920691 [Trichonephila clavipes]